MPIHTNDYPILEYDTEMNGIISPVRHGRPQLPSKCIATYLSEVLDDFVSKHNAEVISHFGSENNTPIYRLLYHGVEVSLVEACVGSASMAAMTDFLIAHGVKELIACGGCGVLTEISAGDIIIPVSALRDEGASYHYLQPSREIALDRDVIDVIEKSLDEFHTPYVEAKTWTTDGFYRETPDMITYRKEEGCSVVEMECSAIAAVAKLRGIRFGQLLYSGDILTDYQNYDERGWTKNLSAREKLFYLSLEALLKL